MEKEEWIRIKMWVEQKFGVPNAVSTKSNGDIVIMLGCLDEYGVYLVDYGDWKGEIEEMGYRIVEVSREDDWAIIVLGR